RFQNALTGINISKKPEAERNRPEQNGNNFEPAYHEEDDNHDHLQKPGRLTLRAENVKQESADSVCLDRPNNPEQKEDRGHCRGHIEIGVAPAQQRSIDMENAVRAVMSPANGAHAGNKPEPVYK